MIRVMPVIKSKWNQVVEAGDFSYLWKEDISTLSWDVERILAFTKHCSERQFFLILVKCHPEFGLGWFAFKTLEESHSVVWQIYYHCRRTGQMNPACRCSFSIIKMKQLVKNEPRNSKRNHLDAFWRLKQTQHPPKISTESLMQLCCI